MAAAVELPFGNAQFDLVVAYNVLMDIDHGRFASKGMDAPFIGKGTYFGRQRFEGVEERDGLPLHFAGWSYPLEAYGTALEEAGLAITSLREPVPDLGDGRNRMGRWLRLPLFLWLKARPLAF